MTLDALKFYQAYIKEMIDVGGPNFPKTISTRLGTRLGKLYKNLGIDEIETALKQCYQVLKGSPKIARKDDETLEITIKYPKKFCPIGGKFNPDKATIIQESICVPYTMGFLNNLESNYNYKGDIHECILSSNKRICRYTLHLKKKTNADVKN